MSNVLERILRRQDMDEQQRRGLFTKLTGKLASVEGGMYRGFCAGIGNSPIFEAFEEGQKQEREACAKAEPTNDEIDAARYRWLRENRDVMLMTSFFGNGCINRTVEEVDSAIDSAMI